MKRILVVEDEDPISIALTDWIKATHKDYEVVLARTGVEALEKVSAQAFDLILLDLVLPEMDGFKFLEELKVRGMRVPVVVVSNLGEEDDIRRARALGVAAYFVKTETKLTQLSEAVNRILGKTA